MQNKNQDPEKLKEQIEREAELLEQEETVAMFKKSSLIVEQIGTAEKMKQYNHADGSDLASEYGWKNIPIEYLPSQGIFYEAATQIAIRAATVAEIRHWSTIDENDLLGVDDMLNYVIEKCCRIKIPGRQATYKDIKEIDRFYLIFAIRDYTFKNGENKLFVNVDEDSAKVEITKDVIDYFNPDERMTKYFDTDRHCFNIKMRGGENFDMFFPSLGTMAFIKNYIKAKREKGQNFDKTFIKYAPFLFSDWRVMSQAAYDKAVQDSYTWSVQKISVLDTLVGILSDSVNPRIRYVDGNGAEVTAPLNFQGGIKSIFLISDVFGELV